MNYSESTNGKHCRGPPQEWWGLESFVETQAWLENREKVNLSLRLGKKDELDECFFGEPYVLRRDFKTNQPIYKLRELISEPKTEPLPALARQAIIDSGSIRPREKGLYFVR